LGQEAVVGRPWSGAAKVGVGIGIAGLAECVVAPSAVKLLSAVIPRCGAVDGHPAPAVAAAAAAAAAAVAAVPAPAPNAAHNPAWFADFAGVPVTEYPGELGAHYCPPLFSLNFQDLKIAE